MTAQVLYGHFDTSIFTLSRIPDARSFTGSKVHMVVGLCEDRSKALHDGPLMVRGHLFACEAYMGLKFGECTTKGVFGDRLRKVKVLIVGTSVLQSPSSTRAELAGTLRADQIVAVRVADDEEGIEGPVWFAELNGPAELLKDDVVFAGRICGKDLHVVRTHWFSFQGVVKGSTHTRYVQLNDDALFNVNSFIRVDGVTFTSPFRRFRRRGRNNKARVWLINEDVYEAVLVSA